MIVVLPDSSVADDRNRLARFDREGHIAQHPVEVVRIRRCIAWTLWRNGSALVR